MAKAKEMEQWATDQEFGTKQLKWYEMKKAIRKVIEEAYEEWHKYNDAIEKHVNGQEVEI